MNSRYFHISYCQVSQGKGQRVADEIAPRLMMTNPIMEGLGNAKTVRNNNSWRFGEFVKIYFSSSGAVAAAAIRTYLLERPRVTQLSKGERGYHVFYRLLRGASTTARATAPLVSADGKPLGVDDFGALASGCDEVAGVSDADKSAELQAAFETVSVGAATQEEVFGLLAGVLHLTNVAFVPAADGEGAAVAEGAATHALAAASSLLGCADLKTGLDDADDPLGRALRLV